MRKIAPALTVLIFFLVSIRAFAEPSGYAQGHYVLPPEVKKQGRLFAGTRIPLDKEEVSSRVVEQINFLLMDNRETLMEWFDRMAVYGPMFRTILEEEQIPADFIYIACLLSDLSPTSRTKSGGIGWWALGGPKDKKDPNAPWSATDDWDDRRDPVISTKIACGVFQTLARKLNNDQLLVICAYRDGLDRVEPYLNKAKGFSYWDLVLPASSEVIIPRLVALKIIDDHKSFYGLSVSPAEPLQYDLLPKLKLNKDLPLYAVAKWTQTSPRVIWSLNPGVNPASGVIPASKKNGGTYPLRVPKGMETTVRQALVENGYL